MRLSVDTKRTSLPHTQLLDIIRAAREEIVLSSSPSPSDPCYGAARADFRASFGRGPCADEAEAIVSLVLKAMANIVPGLKAQGWRCVFVEKFA